MSASVAPSDAHWQNEGKSFDSSIIVGFSTKSDSLVSVILQTIRKHHLAFDR